MHFNGARLKEMNGIELTFDFDRMKKITEKKTKRRIIYINRTK